MENVYIMALGYLKIPDSYNYIAIFLILKCQLKCPWCINIMDYNRSKLSEDGEFMTTKKWIDALNRIEAREDLPLSIQGGEPTLHKGFYEIIANVNRPMDLLTNCQFNVSEFMDCVPRWKFSRNAPYASIRVSYHPEQMDLYETIHKVRTLHDKGYQIGVWMIEFPGREQEFLEAKLKFKEAGIDFRGKELLGEYNGKVYGTFKYSNQVPKKVLCRTTELIVAPDGSVHRCHSDLYNLRPGIGHILDENFKLDREFRECVGDISCNSCDIKIKNNRFQVYGNTSVEQKEIDNEKDNNVSDVPYSC